MAQDAVSLSGVAGRYASALFELASEKNVRDDVAKALFSFESMINESPDLARMVKSPVFSVEEQLKASVGAKSVTIVPKLSLMDGVNAVRTVFGSCWFDEEKCADGLNALRHYKYKVVEGQYSNEPLHDGAGFVDGADAFRYLAVDIGRKRSVDAGGILERMEQAASVARAKFGKRDGRSGTGAGTGWLR